MSAGDDITSIVESAEIVAFPRAARAPGASLVDAEASSAPASAAAVSRPRSGQGASSREDEETPKAQDDDAREDTGFGRDPPSGGDEGGDIDRRLAHFPLTDLGNAERFAARNAKLLRYCPAIGWLWWDGRRWSTAGAEEIVKLKEHATVRAIQNEAKALRDTKDDWAVKWTGRGDDRVVLQWYSDKIAGWGRVSETAAKMAAISKRAAAMLAIDVGKLDADPMKISVLNGTLTIAKREEGDYVTLSDHEPDDYITKLAPVAFDESAECPQFRTFLARIQPDEENRTFLAQWFGYGLTGDVGEQKMIFCYGKGRNGKGVLVNLMSFVAGDYAASIGIETFLDSGRARAGGQATPDLAKLPGVRMLTTSEPKKGATLDDGLVKLITGGDPIDARHLNKDFFSFKPCLKLTMQGNYRPRLPGTDDGIKGRVVLVPFGVFIPPEERDPHLGEKLQKEASGVLNFMLDGLRSFLDAGLVIPGAVKQATEDYFADNDPLGQFLAVCTAPALGKRVQSSDMHALYNAWAKANGEREWSAKGLANALKERGIASKKSVNVYWLDIELTHKVGDFVDPEGRPLKHFEDERWDEEER